MRAPSRIVGLYAIFGALWILLSDRALQLLTENAEILIKLQTVKGWLFIAITALLLYFLVKQQMAELQKLNTDLEKRVAERTRRLEQVNQELESFSYTVSHDLKAPLRGIDGFGFLLQSQYGDSLPEGARHFVTRMREAAAQMNRLIEDLLSYSRIERRELNLRPIDLRRTIDQLLEEKQEQIKQSNVRIDVDLKCEQVYADPDGLLLVLRNLFDNSLKFTKDRVPGFAIRSHTEGDRCIIQFSDNGIGFDPKFNEQIFQIFQRLHSESEFPGTGIGLAIVRKAMTRMEGTVSAEGKPGEGATFTLRLHTKAT